jgi:tetratricopeptide (TPR) repeat protein
VNKIFTLFLLAAFAQAFGTTEDRELVYERLNQGNLDGLEQILNHWESNRPKDMEISEAYGTYYYQKALKEGKPASVQPALTETISLHDPKVEGIFGNEGSRDSVNRDLLRKAEQYWKNAIRSYPWRLDLYLGLAGLYRDLGDFESQYRLLGQGLQYADKHRKKLEWEDRQKLPQPSRKFLPAVLQNHALFYFRKGQPQDNEKAFRLAKLAITFYPNRSCAYNSMAAYYFRKGDFPRSLKYLLIANQKNPRDSLVLNNIGGFLESLQKEKEAAIYYRRVVKLNNDAKCVEEARNHLEREDRN